MISPFSYTCTVHRLFGGKFKAIMVLVVQPLNFEPGRFEIIHRDLSFLKTNLFLFDQYVSLICAKFDPNVIYNNP